MTTYDSPDASTTPVVANAFADGKNLAYFRGRELHGRAVKLPEGYRGVVAAVEKQQSDSGGAQQTNSVEVINVEANQINLGTLEVRGEFDEMVVWEHEKTADATTDHYVRSVEEWLQVADQVRLPPPEKGAFMGAISH